MAILGHFNFLDQSVLKEAVSSGTARLPFVSFIVPIEYLDGTDKELSTVNGK